MHLLESSIRSSFSSQFFSQSTTKFFLDSILRLKDFSRRGSMHLFLFSQRCFINFLLCINSFTSLKNVLANFFSLNRSRSYFFTFSSHSSISASFNLYALAFLRFTPMRCGISSPISKSHVVF